jgi:hypothetical protein
MRTFDEMVTMALAQRLDAMERHLDPLNQEFSVTPAERATLLRNASMTGPARYDWQSSGEQMRICGLRVAVPTPPAQPPCTGSTAPPLPPASA